MKRHLITILLLALSLVLLAQGNYYDAIGDDLHSEALQTALKALISTNTNNSYNGAKAQLFQQLENHNGYVTCIYTGKEFNVGYNYTGSSDPNTEHVYAQSWFSPSESSIKKADLHHLFPCEMRTNSSRGNLPIFTVANHNNADVYYTHTPWQSYRGQAYTGHTVFEPADQSKGNIARALLYFHVRYNDSLVQQYVNMLPELVVWSNEDPPDAHEITRNQGIYEYQGNRNPFIDHPEYVDRIWNYSATDDETIPAAEGMLFSGVYPNPFAAQATFQVSCKQAQKANLAVFDIRGRKVYSSELTLQCGDNQLSWDSEGLAAGIYLIRISSSSESVTAKIVKTVGM
ncbi:MAG TPA: endonuclease [Candidatus Cloacimonadota bacterium]|nr:endonuclease [Candidatus Cloacimonadota bacterium]